MKISIFFTDSKRIEIEAARFIQSRFSEHKIFLPHALLAKTSSELKKLNIPHHVSDLSFMKSSTNSCIALDLREAQGIDISVVQNLKQ